MKSNTTKPVQTLSVAAMQYIAARQADAKNDGGGHCQGGGSW
ncbi:MULTISPECIES: hypothetical protein [Pseudomonas syringae group]|nr:hypothetical protein [Pseudomonas syringae group genomosp. 3]